MPENQQVKLDPQQEKELMEKIKLARSKRDEMFKKNDRNFRVGGIVTSLLTLGLFLYHIPAFRETANEHSIHVVQPDSFWWALVAFVFHYSTRTLFHKLTTPFFAKHLHPKNQYYSEDDRKDKLRILVKQTYEGIYYLFITLFIFVLYREEFWFPTVLGGQGSCSRIFDNYPQWPQTHTKLIEIYFQFQLGTYIFLNFDLLYLSREVYLKKNFGEILFHHITAIMLISFALIYNLIPSACMALYVHDISDSLRGFSRTIGESKLCINYPWLFSSYNLIYLGVWIYMRNIVLPFCLIDVSYYAIPGADDVWGASRVPQLCLLVLNISNFFIQCYWSFTLLRYRKDEQEKNKFFINQLKKVKEGKEEKTA